MPNFSKVAILCVGDVVLDRFVTGDVQSVSREAPVPVYKWLSEQTMLGGAGNVVANLRALGANVTLVARIGKDEAGACVRSLLAKAKVHARLVESDAVPTIEKTRLVARGHHVLKIDKDAPKQPLMQSEKSAILASVEAAVPTVDIVILSDYANGLLEPELTKDIISICHRYGRRILVDPRGHDYGKYAGATLVKPNRQELEIATGVDLSAYDEDLTTRAIEAAQGLLQREDIESAVVTLSERGMFYVTRGDKNAIMMPARVVDVCDVSGAGDTTIAMLAAALASGATVESAMAMATVAAGIVVGKVGTATVTPDEIGCAMEGQGKILSLNAAVRRVRAWQAEGLKVGFTNGCFDCLHCGHLSSLEQSKNLCDRLVVGVNADESVRRLKGPARPLQDEKTRASVLAGLTVVDAVIVFHEDSALKTVEAVRPDVYAKEGYAMDDLPEANLVMSYDGEVVALRRLDGYSTSGMVSRIGGGA